MTPVWDIWIRLFHWTLVVSVLFLLFSGETSIGFFEWHRQVGELVLALITFRIIWGLVGSSNARLASLVASPTRVFHHLSELLKGRAEHQRGHNAAGGWAVLLMLALIGFQACSGLFIADEDELLEGAFYGSFNTATTALLYKLHRLNADFIQVVITVHIAMVFVYLLYARRNLIKPMLTGKMAWPETDSPPEALFQHWLIGLAIAALLGLVFFMLFL